MEVNKLRLSVKQRNNLCTGVRLAAELVASEKSLRKFLTVQGYTYNKGKIIKLSKTINAAVYDKIYFELHCYELPVKYLEEKIDFTEDDLINEIYKENIKGFEELENILSNYIQDFSILTPEWNCENLI